MKVLITGARGQVGRALIASAPANATIESVGHDDFDIGDAAVVQSCVHTVRPDIILNCAAYTAVDKAESEPDIARRANADGPRNLARAVTHVGGRLVHLSTDFVFDGQSSVAYRPNAAPNPLSIYGATKLEGERHVSAELGARAAILRTSWVYAASGKNFLMTMLRLMRERGSVRVVADQIGTPTTAASVATAVWRIASEPTIHGLHHWTDAGVASWYDFAVAIADEWAARTGTSAAEVFPISTTDYPTPARRPAFSVLDRSDTVNALGISPRHWRHNLRDVVGEIPLA